MSCRTSFLSSTMHLHFLCSVLLIMCLRSLVSAEEPSSSTVHALDINKIDYHGNYEDIGGDFKKPGTFFHKFKSFGHFGFIHGFVAAISVIIVSEIGDKTFFIAAIMAMRFSRITVFMGAMSALTVMTILSAFLGFATTVIPRMYTHYISTALFFIFGLKMLREGYYMAADEGQAEYLELQNDLMKRQYEYGGPVDIETGTVEMSKLKYCKRKLRMFFSRVFLEAFTMTFLAEWGDRSQLTTIILASREDAIGVTLGAVIGHGICTTLAVIAGRIIAQRVSVRSVTFIGGVLFLLFAVWALAMGPGS